MKGFVLAAVLFVSLCFAAVASRAQDSYYVEDDHTFHGALVAGGTFTQIDGDTYYGYHKIGFEVGGAMYMMLGSNIAAAMEILYTQKGSKGNAPINNGPFNINQYSINLNYAEVPLMLYYMDKHRHHFGAGLSYSQLISTNEKATTDPDQHTVFTNYPFHKGDLNFILSGNLHIYKGFILGARFQYSLLPIRTNVPPGYGRNEQYNNMWVIRLMYMF